ncbi:MAG TPA: Xaa-Pro peptidase family protein [Longimicrobiales bacterium]
MDRRHFIASGAIAAAAASLNTHDANAEQIQEHPAIANLKSLKPEEPPPISDAERAERRAKAQRLMTTSGVHALLVEPGPSLDYFGGLRWGRSERLFGLLIPRKGEAVVICPAFERERAESQINGRFRIRVWQEDESPYALIGSTLRDWGFAAGTLAVESSARVFVSDALAKVRPAMTVISGDAITQACRGIKDAHEIALMRHANRVTIEAFRATFQTLREGMTQQELSRILSQAFQKLGYNGGALVLFGESSAYPHGLEKPRALEAGQVVLIDGGTSVNGYASDITRTVAFGTPSAEAVKVFEIVREAQRRALVAAKPGKKAGDIDTVARDYVTAQGYGPGYKFFTHRLGHGIGLEGHEWPYLVKGSEVVLRPGMSFSDEPGIYQYGKFGVRLEDIMVITENGADLLTPQARSLAITDI